MSIRGLLLVCLALLAWTMPARAAVVWDFVGGELRGASGVDINGTLYDVTFQDGSCVALFDGCDSPTDFPFADFSDAEAAVQALLAQVFLDSPTAPANFDTTPSLTRGCEADECSFYVPIDIGGSVGHWVAVNYLGATSGDTGFNAVAGAGFETTSLAAATYAVFTPSVAAVPEPVTLGMFGGAIGLLAWARRRRASRPAGRSAPVPGSRGI